MIRVHIICEGQTEETFIAEVLSGPLRSKGIHVSPSLLGKPGRKGGDLRPHRLMADVRARLLGDPGAYCTTLFDFNGLPGDFPGKAEAAAERSTARKSRCLLDALAGMLRSHVGEEAMRRFIPYVQMHEFEGLLFSDVDAFGRALDRIALVSPLQRIRDGFGSPEDINDSATTAPSKRILRVFESYEKPLHGSLAALEIGLDSIRRECALFDQWLTCIEALPGQTSDSQ